MMMSSTSRLSVPAFGIDESVTVTLRINGRASELTLRAISPSGLVTTIGLPAGGRIISAANGLLKMLVQRIPESALTASDSLRTPSPFRGGS